MKINFNPIISIVCSFALLYYAFNGTSADLGHSMTDDTDKVTIATSVVMTGILVKAWKNWFKTVGGK